MNESMFLFDKKIRLKPVDFYYGRKPVAANRVLRFFAFFFDGMILISLLFFIEIFFVGLVFQLPLDKSPKKLFLWHLIYWSTLAPMIGYIYYGFFYLNFAATPGKMLFNLKVVDAKSWGYLGFFQIFLREVVGKFYSVLTLGLGFVLAFLREDGKAFHDIISGTLIISSAQRSPLNK